MREEDLQRVLAESVDELQSRLSDPPTWLIQLEQAFTQPVPDTLPALPIPEALRGKEL
jgi:hypothetical protein